MKKLSDFKDTQGIVVASKVLSVIMDILSDHRNLAMNGERSAIKMFTAFMEHSPSKMREIFAILSEKEINEYHCDGAEAMANMLLLANDPIVVGLFTLQSQKGDAISSGSVSENTEE
jgi:hypothetical protein